jgi:lambda family phage portal protein
MWQSLAARFAKFFGREASAPKLGKRNVFKGAELSRLWYDWIASPISADQEIYNDFLRLRARAREMRRNHPLVRRFVAMLSTNVIGPEGHTLRARIRNADGKLNQAMNVRIEAAWDAWSSDNTSVDGMMGLVDLEHLAIESLAVDGEVLIRMHRGFRGNAFRFALQLVDPDLLDHLYMLAPEKGSNEVRLGVEVDKWGRPVAYHFWERHQTDLPTPPENKRIRVPAEEILHLYRPDRPNQSRGTTWLNSMMFPAKMLDGYVEAEVVAARTGAAKMGFFEQKDADTSEPAQAGERISMEASPGQFETLPPGYEFKPWSPEHPSTAFGSFLKSVQRWIASGLRVSYNELANDLDNVNYSSLRSALLSDRDEWRKLQRWWARRVRMTIYENWLSMAELAGKIVLDTRPWEQWLQVTFAARGWAWVDPLKDVNASIAAIDNGLSSRTRVLAEQGLDFEEVIEELAAEQARIKELGVVLTGLGVGPGAAAGDDPAAQGAGGEDSGSNRNQRLRLVRGLLEHAIHEQ